MTTVGDRKVLFSGSFIIPAGESASFEVPPLTTKFRIEFPPGAPASGQPETKWIFSNGTLVIVFTGWNNSLGGSFLKPTKVGSLADGRDLSFNVAIYDLGGTHFVNIEIYAGGTFL
jgi:hypothetical protein